MGIEDGIRRIMASRPTPELLEIWEQNDQDEYSPLAFEIIAEILIQRGETLPEQRPGIRASAVPMTRRDEQKDGPARVAMQGRSVICQVCGRDLFYQRRVQLNTKAMTLLGLDILDQRAKCLVCARCGHIHWFA